MGGPSCVAACPAAELPAPAPLPSPPQVHDALEAQQHLAGAGAAELFWRLQLWPSRLAEGLADAGLRLRGYRGDFREQLAADQRELDQALALLQVGARKGQGRG
jgi:hypothetical protein